MVAYPFVSSSDRLTIEALQCGKIYARALEFYKAKLEAALEGRRECN